MFAKDGDAVAKRGQRASDGFTPLPWIHGPLTHPDRAAQEASNACSLLGGVPPTTPQRVAPP